MCLLSYFPAGIIPDELNLWRGACNNGDGHGYAIATPDGKLFVHRGLDAESVIEQFTAERERHPEGPAMFHSRWSTGGLLDVGNCHPFRVGRDRRTVVAHNGVLFSVPRKEKRSDTRIFAEQVMGRKYPELDSRRTRRRLEKYLGGYNKLAVITVNPRYKHQGYLFNEQAGLWHNGEWHSNGDFAKVYSRGTVTAAAWWDDGYTKGEDGHWHWTGSDQAASAPWQRGHGLDCELCGARQGVDEATLYCTVCRSCAECLEAEDDCLCYVPQALRDRDTIEDPCEGCEPDDPWLEPGTGAARVPALPAMTALEADV